MFRVTRVLLLLLGVALLSSCDWTGLAYNHLGFVARHYVAGFVDLRPEQQRAFDQAFGEFWQWHRQTELPRYASTARHFAAASQTLQTPQQVDDEILLLDQFGNSLSQHLLQQIAPLLPSLDDAQVAQILAEIDRRIEKSAKRSDALDDAHWRLRQSGQTIDGLEKFAGTLTPAQRHRVQTWTQTLPRDAALARAAAQAWRNAFAEVLHRRHEPDNLGRVLALTDVNDPVIARFQRQRSDTRSRYVALLAELSGSYTAAQRQKLASTLSALAADLERLATDKPASN